MSAQCWMGVRPGRPASPRPLKAFRLRYVPVVMVYFAYGALGLIDVTRDLWIKESLSLYAVAACRHRRLAEPALDREDGVRRAGRHRPDLRLAAESLHPDRRRADGGGPRHPRWRRRPLAHLHAGRSTLHSRRHADGDRHRGAGRGGRCDVHRGGAAHRCRRPRAPGQRGTRRARHGAGARPARGLRRRTRGGGVVGLARQHQCRARTCS